MFVKYRLQGKVAVITGGSGGTGEATVRLFANHGAQVIIADIADDAGMKVAESLSPWSTYIHSDVSKEQYVSADVDLAREKHGKLDIMFNNAGITNKQNGSVAEYDMQEFKRVMNINVKGVMHGIKHAGHVMIPKKKGCIISTASIAGVMGGIASYSYTTSEHAIIGLTKNGEVELGKYAEEKAQRAASRYSRGNLKEATLEVEDIAEAALYLE
ncbi:hypothetical protein SUGI_0673060 [Cryptomeria japonica]|nr:hypothetical protein SUGI_0673060 [Cryptomeria japonica]